MKISSFFANICLLFFIVVFFSACSAKKKAQKSPKAAKKGSLTYVVERIESNQIQAEWFKAKAKIKAGFSGRSQTFNADIRMKKDSIVWLSAYPNFGIKLEVARAIITKDSVMMINRFDKQYFAEPISYIEKIAGYPFDFALIQNTILGNVPVNHLNGENAGISKKEEEGTYLLTGLLYDLPMKMSVDERDFSIREMNLTHPDTNQKVNVKMENYEMIEKKLFATHRNIYIEAPDIYTADVRFSRVSMEENLSFPFTINRKKYKRIR